MTVAEMEAGIDDAIEFLKKHGLVNIHYDENGEERLTLSDNGQNLADQLNQQSS